MENQLNTNGQVAEQANVSRPRQDMQYLMDIDQGAALVMRWQNFAIDKAV